MIQNKKFKILYQGIFVILGVIAILASLGLFEEKFDSFFYVYFTNISNYICIFIMFMEFIETVNSKENQFVKYRPLLKFVGVLIIFLTFVVYNFLLAKDRPISENLSIYSILLHIVLPIMYIVDWILFYEHKKVKWYYPLLATVVPILYYVYIFARASILDFKSNLLYPYFFLDYGELGFSGLVFWFIILAIGYIGVGYLLFLIDNKVLSYKKNK